MTISFISRRAADRCALVLTLTAALSGCFDDQSSSSQPAAVGTATESNPAGVVNQAPEITGVPSSSIESGQTYSFAPTALDADQDFLEFQISNKPGWAQFSNETGVLSGTPQDSDVGQTGDITIAVSDGRDSRAVGPFRIKISQRGTTPSSANTPPVISGTPASSAQIDQPYRFVPTASDANKDKLTFLISNRPSWASFSTATGAMTGTPVAANIGSYSKIVISVNDGRLTSSLPAFTVQVNGADNRAPTISGSPSTSAQVAQAYAFTPVAADADSDALSFSVQNKPAWATFSASNGRLTGSPAAANVGSYANIQISVTDGKATTSLSPFSITVQTAANRAPTISGSPATAATVGSTYSFQPSASDPDGDSLGFTIQNRPTWAAFSTTSGALTGTPTAAGTTANIIISASDGKTQASLPAFAIVVSQPANGAPTISGTPATTVTVGAAYNFQPAASDPNGDPLSWTITGKPSWATFNTTTGRLSGTPSAAGTFANIAIMVSDGKSTVGLAPFAITVAANAQGSATLSWQPPTENTDGSPLVDLAGFRIAYGTNTAALTQTVEIASPGTSNYTVGGLMPATWYFAVKAYTAAGAESELSGIASKTIP